MIGFGIPWCALGPKSLFSDSGFLLIYELLVWMHEKRGVQSLLYLEPHYREKFELSNDPKKTGVRAVYPGSPLLVKSRSDESAVDRATVYNYFSARRCPIDFVFTNKKLSVTQLAVQTRDHRGEGRIPILLQPLYVGVEGCKAPPWREKLLVPTRAEAASYALAASVLWTTEEQRGRGLQICKRMLSSFEVREVERKGAIIGGGILPMIRRAAKSDTLVKKELQKPKDAFEVSFVGRVTGTKNFAFILETMRTLFVKEGILLNVLSTGDVPFPKQCRVSDPENLIGDREAGGHKGREYYAERILPALQCVMYASKSEGHPSVPREVIYVGVPCLLPAAGWAKAMFHDEYPFYYRGKVEALALLKRIKAGQITDAEVDRFNACRHAPEMIEFMDSTAEKILDLAEGHTKAMIALSCRHSHSRISAAFEEAVKVNEVFTWDAWLTQAARMGFAISEMSRGVAPMQLYRWLHDKVVCVDPRKGLFRRAK